MRLLHGTTGAACLFALTLGASAQESRRAVLDVPLDPALAMGPSLRTEVALEPSGDMRLPHTNLSLRRQAGAAYWNRPYIYWTRGTYEGETLIGTPSRVSGAPEAFAARPRAATVREIADGALREGQYDVAAAHEAALHEEGDAPSPGYIVATEGAGRTGVAAALLVERLRVSGDGKQLRLDRAGLVSQGEVRRLQRLASGYAESAPDPNAWVLTASYMYERGQRAAAARAVERAVEGGLDSEVAQVLTGLFPDAGTAP